MKFKYLFRSRIPLVNKIINENSSSFNDLNNDLLFEIFDYLSYNDILLSFSNLNIYFNELIKNIPQHIDLRLHKQFPNYIRSLKISGSYQLSLIYSFKNNELASLRSITMANLKPQDVLILLKYLPFKQLEYIYLGVCAFDKIYSKNKTLSNIQNEILCLSQYRLKKCYLKEKFSILIDDLPQILYSLEYLQLVACQNLFILSQLLSRTPNLKYVNVSTIEINRIPLISNKYNLTHLSIRPHLDCSLMELKIFLNNCCPHLNKLIVELYIYRGKQPSLLINKYQWIKTFPYQLKYFHLKSIPSSSINLSKIKDDHLQLPLKENVCLVEEHYCQIIIDPPLIHSWTKIYSKQK